MVRFPRITLRGQDLRNLVSDKSWCCSMPNRIPPVSLLDPVHRPCEKNKLDKSFSHSQTIWWHNGGMRIIIVTNTFTVQQSLSNDRIMKAIEERESWGPITNGLVVVVIGLKSNFMLGRPIQNIFFFPFLSLCLICCDFYGRNPSNSIWQPPYINKLSNSLVW